MSTATCSLRPIPPSGAAERRSDHEDLGLTAGILATSALPLALAGAGLARWEETSVGLGTLGVLFAGRELLRALAARARAGGLP